MKISAPLARRALRSAPVVSCYEGPLNSGRAFGLLSWGSGPAWVAPAWFVDLACGSLF